MTIINAGKLTKKVSFFSNAKVPDGSGGFNSDSEETLLLTTWSSIKQIKATRVAENFQEGINSVYEIKIRQRADFIPQSDYTVKLEVDKVCEIVEIVEDFDEVGKAKQWLITVVHRGVSI